LPGTIYAKVLRELWTGISPSGAYWNHTQIVSDNRIPAMQTDSTAYSFTAAEEGDIQLRAQLIFRRAFISLVEQKGWDTPDILMAEKIIELSP
jgi:hypothetical protein